MKTHIKILSLSIAAYFGVSGSLLAAPFAFTDGDLILGVQATGGTGQTTNVFFNLGSGISHRDNGNLGLLGNIGTTLSSAYGNNWYTRTDLYFGVFGNLKPNPNTGIGSAGATNGDPSRTVYVSRAASAPGLSTTWTGLTSTGLGAAGTTFSGMEQMVVTLTANADNSATLNQTTQPTEWNNGWTINNPTPGGGFNIFGGGIQQSFGQGGSATYVDVQRIISTTTGATPTGTVGTGSYETTISISSTGAITASSPSSSSTYATWATTNGVTGQAANLDHDNDGVSNGVEHFLVGPNTVSTGFTPLPGIVTAGVVNSVTWAKAGTYTGVYGTDFWVETSTSLAAGSWTNETLGVNVVINGNSVKYTFPAGPVKTFARLKVTGP